MRIDYDKKVREIAKRRGYGLVTISWTTLEGTRLITQLAASERVIRYVQHAEQHAVKLSRELEKGKEE